MNAPHLRPSRPYRPIDATSIPVSQSVALRRRQALEAKQRAYQATRSDQAGESSRCEMMIPRMGGLVR
jgi:hypothetical protein